jgi:hypothetical protein
MSDEVYPYLTPAAPSMGCDQCGTCDITLAYVGHEIDYANGDAMMCEACVRAALALFEAPPVADPTPSDEVRAIRAERARFRCCGRWVEAGKVCSCGTSGTVRP